jgi:hypothetical protein
MVKKGGCKRVQDADFAVRDKIRKPEASLDDTLPPFDLSTLNDMFARLDDWSSLDEMFAWLGDFSTLAAMFAAQDQMLPKVDGIFQPIDKPMRKRRPHRGARRTSHR